MRQSRNVGLLLCCALAPAPEPAQRHEPRGMFEWFRVDLVSRARRPLELGHAKQEQAGSSFRCYLDGATSSVVFPYGETLVIDAPVEEPTKLDEQKKNPDIKLERLALKNGRRYATGSYIPLIVTDTGEQVQIVAPQDKKKNRPIAARIYWYGNAQTLAPGEYAVSWRGMARDYLGCSFTGAFRISADVPAAQHSAPARHPAPPSAPQTPAVPTDMRQLREAAERGDRAAQQQLGYS